jgi:hypothetical protein
MIKSRRVRWADHIARIWKMRDAFNILVGKTDEKRPLGRPRCRWEGNDKIDHKEIGCGLDLSGSEQETVVSSCELGNESSGFMKDGEFLDERLLLSLKKDSAACS